MTTENHILMKQGRDALTGKWGMAIVIFLVYSLIMGTISIRETSIFSFLISGPMMLGAATVALAFARDQEPRAELLFSGFRHFGTAFLTYVIMMVLIFLWLLLLIVPGIIAALSYSMSFYILADEPSLKAMEAIDRSKQMMEGHKLKLFTLYLRFLVLALLCILTLGIGFLWLVPYMYVTTAKFYEDVKAANLEAEESYSEADIV